MTSLVENVWGHHGFTNEEHVETAKRYCEM